jgi:hypothetical protein
MYLSGLILTTPISPHFSTLVPYGSCKQCPLDRKAGILQADGEMHGQDGPRIPQAPTGVLERGLRKRLADDVEGFLQDTATSSSA